MDVGACRPLGLERSKWLLGHCLVLHRLEACARNLFKNSVLLGTAKRCCTELCCAMLAHGYDLDHISKAHIDGEGKSKNQHMHIMTRDMFRSCLSMLFELRE